MLGAIGFESTLCRVLIMNPLALQIPNPGFVGS